MKPRGWQPPAWFVTVQAKQRFIRGMQQVVDGPIRTVKPSLKRHGGLALSFTITPPRVPPRRARIEFAVGNPEVPRARPDRPREAATRDNRGRLSRSNARDPS